MQYKHVIGLCGYPASGKDTFANVLVQEFDFERVAFADPLREMALIIDPLIPTAGVDGLRLSTIVHENGWTVAKRFREIRRLLQVLGTECGRNIHGDNCWVDIGRKKIEATTKSVVITDVRFPNEVGMIRSMAGSILHIKRPGCGKVNGHPSEQLDYDAASDATMDNNGSMLDFMRLSREFGSALVGDCHE